MVFRGFASHRNETKKVNMIKAVYLGLSIFSKIQNHSTWIQIAFFIRIKTEAVYTDIADDVEKRFDTSNYEINRPYLQDKNKIKKKLD